MERYNHLGCLLPSPDEFDASNMEMVTDADLILMEMTETMTE
jgi:hypothetical protein